MEVSGFMHSATDSQRWKVGKEREEIYTYQCVCVCVSVGCVFLLLCAVQEVKFVKFHISACVCV